MAESKQIVKLKDANLFLVDGELSAVVSKDEKIAFIKEERNRSIQKYIDQFLKNYLKYRVRIVEDLYDLVRIDSSEV